MRPFSFEKWQIKSQKFTKYCTRTSRRIFLMIISLIFVTRCARRGINGMATMRRFNVNVIIIHFLISGHLLYSIFHDRSTKIKYIFFFLLSSHTFFNKSVFCGGIEYHLPKQHVFLEIKISTLFEICSYYCQFSSSEL